ncbi:MAG TPA: hypothetical protein VF816_06910 [Rhodocyclaceae bacterium]
MEKPHWHKVLLAARQWKSYPLVVGLLAVVSSGTALYPFMPVLIAAIALAPARWPVIYLSSVLGSAAGAGLLAAAVQTLGDGSFAAGMQWIGTAEGWLETRTLIRDYGDYAMAITAALPVPQVPVLVALALAKTSPLTIAAAVLVGKCVKYGAYVLGTEAVIGLVRRVRRALGRGRSGSGAEQR